MTEIELHEEIVNSFTRFLEPEENLTLQQFFERGFELTKRDRFKTFNIRYSPWIRELARWYDDRECEWVYLIMASQVSKTTFMLGLLLYLSLYVRGAVPGMWIHQTGEAAKKFCKQKLEPFLSKRGKQALKTGTWEKHGFKINNMELSIANAFNKTTLRTDNIRFFFGDEVSLWRESIEYIKLRGRSFTGKTFGVFSTTAPDNPNHHSYKEMQAANHFLWFVPCPYCNMFQYMRFSQVKWYERKPGKSWDHDKVKASAHYECIGCGGKWFDKDKLDIINAGRMQCIDPETKKPKEPENRDARFVRLPSMYTIFTPFGKLASLFLTAKEGGYLALRTFNTDQLAKAFQPLSTKKKIIRSDDLLKFVDENRRMMETGTGYNLYTASADVQDEVLYLTVWGWNAGLFMSGHLVYANKIRWKNVKGKPDWNQLETEISPFIRVLHKFVFDATDGENQRAIIDFCLRYGDPFYPLIDTGVKQIDRYKKTKSNKDDRQTEIHINSSYYKNEISEALKREPNMEGAWSFPVDTPDDLFIHFVNEKPVADVYNGREVTRWQKSYQDAPQHYWSSSVYAYAATEDKRARMQKFEVSKEAETNPILQGRSAPMVARRVISKGAQL